MARQVIDTTTNNGSYTGDPAKTAFEKVNDNFEELYGGAANSQISKAAIWGLRLEWVSSTSVRIGSGLAYVPDLNAPLQLASSLTKTPSLAANTWYHAYLYLNGSAADVEFVTTAPGAAYAGTARGKSGATGRRYLGSVRTNASGGLHKFVHELASGKVSYLVDINTTGLQLVANGAATAETTVSAASAVPVTGTCALLVIENNAASGLVFMSNPDVGSPPSSNILNFVRAARGTFVELPLSTSQTFTYQVSGAATLSAYCTGYRFER